MKRTLLITGLAFVTLALAGPHTNAFVLGTAEMHAQYLQDITAEEARKAALEAVPGTIIKEELENKRGRAVYEFYIRKADGSVYEVYVDGNSGKVTKVESKIRS